jgi:hypothetical protein
MIICFNRKDGKFFRQKNRGYVILKIFYSLISSNVLLNN